MDVLSWIALTVTAILALAGAVGWLRAKLVGREYVHHAHRFEFARGPLGGLLLACFLLVGVELVAGVSIKEVVFDGWLDSVADSVDGTSDREERMAKHRQGSGRGSLVGA